MDNKHKLFWALLFLAGFSLCPLFLCDIAKATTLHYEDIVINVYGNAQYNKNVELRSWDDTTATDYYDTTDSDGKWSLTIEAGEYGVWVDSVYEGRFIATPDLMTDVVIGKTKGDTIKFKGTVVIDSAITFTTAVPDSAKKCQHADTAAYTSTVADSTRASRKADSAYTWAAYADSADGANLIDGINGAALMLKADMDDSTARFMLLADMDDSVSNIVTDSLANYLLLANLGDSITADRKSVV